MATQLFKEDGSFVWVEYDRVQAHIAQGYQFNDPGKPAPKHPDVILPAGMGLEKLSPAEQEKVILKEMGIEDMTPLNPANRPTTPTPVAVVGKTEERQKRKYTRKAK